ncbi:hypothetical protein R2E40_10015 [Aeromonas sp. CD]|uniref:hypothetical protein n=1 Tax=Aeromonas TaxID=642 RepID=UPI002965FF06|nr:MULTISPECIES: hypothetical protein [Aeromonas]WOX54423.1 hypothetical protein R2E40_10015 [Aeromonas sp. CD]
MNDYIIFDTWHDDKQQTQREVNNQNYQAKQHKAAQDIIEKTKAYNGFFFATELSDKLVHSYINKHIGKTRDELIRAWTDLCAKHAVTFIRRDLSITYQRRVPNSYKNGKYDYETLIEKDAKVRDGKVAAGQLQRARIIYNGVFLWGDELDRVVSAISRTARTAASTALDDYFTTHPNSGMHEFDILLKGFM